MFFLQMKKGENLFLCDVWRRRYCLISFPKVGYQILNPTQPSGHSQKPSATVLADTMRNRTPHFQNSIPYLVCMLMELLTMCLFLTLVHTQPNSASLSWCQNVPEHTQAFINEMTTLMYYSSTTDTYRWVTSERET